MSEPNRLPQARRLLWQGMAALLCLSSAQAALVARYSFEDAANRGLDSGPNGLNLDRTGAAATFAAGQTGAGFDSALQVNLLTTAWIENTNTTNALHVTGNNLTIMAWVKGRDTTNNRAGRVMATKANYNGSGNPIYPSGYELAVNFASGVVEFGGNNNNP
jgi:hypothetical protein